MIDQEVERLRRLRGSALQVRTLARLLQQRTAMADDAALPAGQQVAWRLARTVSGHLRAHPYASFQKDVSVPVLLFNAIRSRVASFGVSTSAQMIGVFSARLKRLLRELDDARSLTRDAQLSEAFGRSQREIRFLVSALSAGSGARTTQPDAGIAVGGVAARDWPYVAI